MSHLIPFSISGYTLTHVKEGDPLNEVARSFWNDSHHLATQVWRDENYIACENDDRFLAFAITDPGGDFYGTWALYRIREIDGDPNRISALPAPILPEIEFHIPGEMISEAGEILNATEIEECKSVEASFWCRSLAIIEHMVMHPLPFEDGGELIVDHFRFPRAEDGDPAQHEWIGKRSFFDRHSKLEIFFDNKEAATRTGDFKPIDPCPDRERGEFVA